MVRRVTTNGMMMNYKSNLMNSYKTLGQISEKVTTQRNFNSYAENPAKASQAFQLRRERWNTETQITNSMHVTHKLQQAWNCLDDVYQDLGNGIGVYSTLLGENGTIGAGGSALGDTIRSAADSMLFTMNAKYGERYIFSGADGDTVPFSWELDQNGDVVYNADGTRNLMYRGLKVNDPANEAEIKRMLAEEHTYVDLGMGMTEDNGKLISASAYDSSLNGLHFLGYGEDNSDGEKDPMNVISLMDKMGAIFSARNPDTGAFDPNVGGQDDVYRIHEKLQDALNGLHSERTAMDTEAKFVKTNTDRLQSLDDTLNEQIVDIEDIDPADAITSLMWAQYSYNAALRIGTQLLSQSLIDYLN